MDARNEKDLPTELTLEDLATIAQAWPWELRDVFGRWLGGACTKAGITDKRQRLALQEQLGLLTGEFSD